jgi:glycerol 3-phosphatase-2
MAWLLDLDGVVWLAHEPIAGASEAIRQLQAAGETVLFVTNFSALTESEVEAKLADVGVDATGSVITSAMAAGSLISVGERAFVCAGAGVEEAVERAGGICVGPEEQIDVVVVGFHKDFDFAEMAAAAHALHTGARLIATNTDPTYPTPDRLLPGNGALVAAIATAGKVEAVVAGKPHEPVAALIHKRLSTTPGDPENFGRHVMVGDLPATDGALARLLGFEFAFVGSGVTTAEQALAGDPKPDSIFADLAEMVAVRADR